MLIIHPADINCPEFDAWWSKNKDDIYRYKQYFGLTLESLGKLIWTAATVHEVASDATCLSSKKMTGA